MSAIIMLGFMGSGKSAVARSLSRRLGMPFLDLDARIETEIGCSIAEFFAREGEPKFREIETRLLLELLQKKAVISPGGGVAAQPDNQKILQEAAQNGALIAYLRARPETLAARIRLAPGKRPLIDGQGELDEAATRKRVEELLQERAPLYEKCANLIVKTDDLSIFEVAKQIERVWRLKR